MQFKLPYKISMSDTDAAGVVFFARYFDIAHLCYQEFMAAAGFALSRLLREGAVVIPIIHSECDYKGPLFLDDDITVTAACSKNGVTSFTMDYTFMSGTVAETIGFEAALEGKPIATVRTVHVHIDAKTRKPEALPVELKSALGKIAIE